MDIRNDIGVLDRDKIALEIFLKLFKEDSFGMLLLTDTFEKAYSIADNMIEISKK